MDYEKLKKIKESAQKYYIAVTSPKYKYIIGYGNNSTLVKRVMKTRNWWIELPFPSPAFNFKWLPISKGINYEKLSIKDKKRYLDSPKQAVNHLEFHRELSRKSNLFINMELACEVNMLRDQ